MYPQSPLKGRCFCCLISISRRSETQDARPRADQSRGAGRAGAGVGSACARRGRAPGGPSSACGAVVLRRVAAALVVGGGGGERRGGDLRRPRRPTRTERRGRGPRRDWRRDLRRRAPRGHAARLPRTSAFRGAARSRSARRYKVTHDDVIVAEHIKEAVVGTELVLDEVRSPRSPPSETLAASAPDTTARAGAPRWDRQSDRRRAADRARRAGRVLR